MRSCMPEKHSLIVQKPLTIPRPDHNKRQGKQQARYVNLKLLFHQKEHPETKCFDFGMSLNILKLNFNECISNDFPRIGKHQTNAYR